MRAMVLLASLLTCVAARAEEPARPPLGDFEARARLLFEAIVQDAPEHAVDVFFPRAAFLQVKAMQSPGRYYDRLHERFVRDVHALHRSLPELAHAQYERFELAQRGGWVEPGEEGNRLPYWASRHCFLYYRVGQEVQRIEVRVLITWEERWYLIHLSEFH